MPFIVDHEVDRQTWVALQQVRKPLCGEQGRRDRTTNAHQPRWRYLLTPEPFFQPRI